MAGGEFFEQFIDDYFSECDEHLALLRRVLLSIDTADSPGAAELQQMARALHTLKGLSGMVGLTGAEETAHAMEDAARAFGQTGLSTPDLIETLFAGESVLETIIDSRRRGVEGPSAEPYVERVRQLLASSSPVSPSGGRMVALQRVGSTASCRFEFVPSAELSARGVGVEVIRQRLSGIGEITAVVPRVRAAGGSRSNSSSPSDREPLPTMRGMTTGCIGAGKVSTSSTR